MLACSYHSRMSVACPIPCLENDAFEPSREAQYLYYGLSFQFCFIIMICPGPVRVYLSVWFDYILSEGRPR